MNLKDVFLSHLTQISLKEFYKKGLDHGIITKTEAIQDLKRQREEITEVIAWLEYGYQH